MAAVIGVRGATEQLGPGRGHAFRGRGHPAGSPELRRVAGQSGGEHGAPAGRTEPPPELVVRVTGVLVGLVRLGADQLAVCIVVVAAGESVEDQGGDRARHPGAPAEQVHSLLGHRQRAPSGDQGQQAGDPVGVVGGDGVRDALFGIGGHRIGRPLEEWGEATAVRTGGHEETVRAYCGDPLLRGPAGPPETAGLRERLPAPYPEQCRERLSVLVGGGRDDGPPGHGIDPAGQHRPLCGRCGQSEDPHLVVDLAAQVPPVGGDRGEESGLRLGLAFLVAPQLGQQAVEGRDEPDVRRRIGQIDDRPGPHDGDPVGQLPAAAQYVGGKPDGAVDALLHPRVGHPGQSDVALQQLAHRAVRDPPQGTGRGLVARGEEVPEGRWRHGPGQFAQGGPAPGPVAAAAEALDLPEQRVVVGGVAADGGSSGQDRVLTAEWKGKDSPRAPPPAVAAVEGSAAVDGLQQKLTG